MKKVAISACLLGYACRYDGDDNLNTPLLNLLNDYELLPFCPEEHCFGTPRPTMDLVQDDKKVFAVSNTTGKDISAPLKKYAENFFKDNPKIVLYLGKDRSPSCAVKSGKIYDVDKKLLALNGTGLMSRGEWLG